MLRAPQRGLIAIFVLALLTAGYVTLPPTPPGGVTGQVQWNNAGALGGTSALTASSTTIALPFLTTQGKVCATAAGVLSTTTGLCSGETAGGGVVNASKNVQNLNPAAVSSSVGLMAGLGPLGATITPSGTGRVLFVVSGYYTKSGGNGQLRLRYGTGAAPANGAAIVGTVVGTLQTMITTQSEVDFSIQAVVTGLTLSTAYWWDIDLLTSNASSSQASTVSVTAVEM